MKRGERQAEVYNFVCQFISDHGYAPSVREIAAGCGISVCTTQFHLCNLEEQGKIRHNPKISRSIVVTSNE